LKKIVPANAIQRLLRTKNGIQPTLGLEKAGISLRVFHPVDGNYKYDAPADQTEILWKCLKCGELKQRNKWSLGPCPACGAPRSEFVLVDED
jgi:hypothetical protein